MPQYANYHNYVLGESETISRTLGENSLDYAAALSNLGHFLVLHDDPVRAQPLLQKALAIYEHSAGPEHPDLIPVLNSLGLIFSGEHKFGIAQRFLERAREIASKNFGKENSRFPELEYSMSGLLIAEDKTPEAEAIVEHTNLVLRRIYGEIHYKVAESYRVLGMVYAFRRRGAKAETAYRRSIEIYEQTLGDHPVVAGVLMEYANLLKKSNKDYARELERRSKGIVSRLQQ